LPVRFDFSDIPQSSAAPLAGVTAGCPDRMGLSALSTAAGQLDTLAAAASAQRLLRVLARRLQGTRTRLIAGSMSDGA